MTLETLTVKAPAQFVKGIIDFNEALDGGKPSQSVKLEDFDTLFFMGGGIRINL